jgi:hypothetical protein
MCQSIGITKYIHGGFVCFCKKTIVAFVCFCPKKQYITIAFSRPLLGFAEKQTVTVRRTFLLLTQFFPKWSCLFLPLNPSLV